MASHLPWCRTKLDRQDEVAEQTDLMAEQRLQPRCSMKCRNENTWCRADRAVAELIRAVAEKPDQVAKNVAFAEQKVALAEQIVAFAEKLILLTKILFFWRTGSNFFSVLDDWSIFGGSNTTCKSQKHVMDPRINLKLIKVRNPMIILWVLSRTVMNIKNSLIAFRENSDRYNKQEWASELAT